MAKRQFYPSGNAHMLARPCREVWRCDTPAGEVILLETMEEMFLEARAAPWDDRVETVPVLRVVCEDTANVNVFPKEWTLVLDGYSEGGTVVETIEIHVDRRDSFFGRSCGRRFNGMVKSVQIRGCWGEPVAGANGDGVA